MAQIIPIVSEALQSTIRRLLPSQNGFGEDLQAQNVIVPIIDLTPSAEGSALSTDLARAMSFTGQTSFVALNGAAVVANSPGFYRIFGAFSGRSVGSATTTANFSMSDGLATKVIWGCDMQLTPDPAPVAFNFDFNVFLAAGESITANSSGPTLQLEGSVRQIADVNGQVSNPAGYIDQ